MAANFEQIRKRFEEAVGECVDAFLELFELNPKDCWWVGDRVGLDLFCFGDMYAISLEDMMYCIEHNVKYNEYLKYLDYCTQASEFNLPLPNLRSWCEGAPRASDATIQHLKQLKRNLEKAINDAKEF